jgi:uncharacterized protein (TIGR02246 family)
MAFSHRGDHLVHIKWTLLVLGGVLAAVGLGRWFMPHSPGQAQVREVVPTKPGLDPEWPDDKARKSDRDAIEKAAQGFIRAFEKGDAKTIASLWTEQGEMQDASGARIRGRAAIEKAYADFFKEKPGVKIEVLIEAIRFPAAGVAIEEGLLRQVDPGRDLPATTLYSTVHVREGAQWKIASSREWSAGQDRLEDLDWLVGKWRAKFQDQEVTLTFTRNDKKPFLSGEFTRKTNGKVVSTGTMRISADPQTGQLRSWHFDEDGGHGQALWVRDRNQWVLDSVGVLRDGTETASVNLLGRLNNDAITWRSIDRVMGGQQLPDTVPLKLTRVREGK